MKRQNNGLLMVVMRNNEMSEIRGNGYGDKHDWRHHSTEPMPYPQDRSSLWVCNKCGEMFRHWYNVIPNIFQQMKDLNVKEECNG